MLFKKDCYTCEFIKKYIIVLISIVFLLLIVFSLNIFAIGKSYSKYTHQQMKFNIYEYNEVDLEQLCRISNCSYVINSEDKYYTAYHGSNKGLWLKRDDSKKVKINHIFDEYYFSNNNDILLYVNTADAFFALDLQIFIDELKITYLVTFILVYLITFVFMYFSFKREEKEHMIQSIGSEAILSNQSMILITENVHHEMNTPMEVIDNKLEKVHRIINEYIQSEYLVFEQNGEGSLTKERIALNRKIVSLNKDFDFIKLAIEQVFTTLDRMRGFKHLRYSNGNKTLFDICEGACKIITISNSGFSYDIDYVLQDYKIMHNGSRTLKNVDLLNVVINHLKNSLEAKSSDIIIKFDKIKDGMLYINIIDNGNGIPKEALPNVFKANYSTKKDTSVVRGNGMYLNKYILNASGGDVKVIDSSINGTIISVSLLAYYEERKIY